MELSTTEPPSCVSLSRQHENLYPFILSIRSLCVCVCLVGLYVLYFIYYIYYNNETHLSIPNSNPCLCLLSLPAPIKSLTLLLPTSVTFLRWMWEGEGSLICVKVVASLAVFSRSHFPHSLGYRLKAFCICKMLASTKRNGVKKETT